MELIIRHVAAKREQGTLELDWPLRKKWLERICKLALRMRTPQVRGWVGLGGCVGVWVRRCGGRVTGTGAAHAHAAVNGSESGA